jgi:hypothetical protein
LSGNRLLKKCRVTMVILLFIGIAIIPYLPNSILQASSEGTSIMVTTQACGINGFGNTTVKLTRQQYQKLELFLVNFEARLNHTATREETVLLFKEAVIELNTYGLLPKGMTVGQTERLVSGDYQNPKMLSKFENNFQDRMNKRHNDNSNLNFMNVFCLLFAAATKIPEYYPNSFIIPFGVLLVLSLIPAILVSFIGSQELANTLAEFGLFLWMLNPFRAFNFVVCMGYEVELRSVGLKGLVHETLNNGSIFMGFSGLMLSPFNNKTYFLGFAFVVENLGERLFLP